MSRYLWLLILATAMHAGVARAENNVQLMANTSPPYADTRLPGQGLALELVQHVAAGTDYQVSFTIESWSRALEGASMGVYDGLATAWYSDERAQSLEFSEPYLASKLIILKLRSDHTVYNELQDLAGKRLAINTDYAYGVDFAAIPDLVLVKENHVIQSLLRLLDGSVDFVIGDRRTLVHQMHEFLQDRQGSIMVTGISLPDVKRHVALSRDMSGYEKLIAQFNSSLAASRKNGSLAAIIKKWDEQLGTID